MLSAFASAFKTPELRKKIFFTLGILLVFRLGSTIPAPNVNMQALNTCLDKASGGQRAGLYSLINLFSGGALLHLTIFACTFVVFPVIGLGLLHLPWYSPGLALGLAFATSDATVTSRRLRWTMTVHSMLSFFYNAIVMAIAFKIITG